MSNWLSVAVVVLGCVYVIKSGNCIVSVYKYTICDLEQNSHNEYLIGSSGGPNRTGLTGFTGPVRYPVRFGPVRYFPQIPNRTFLMKCVPKWYLRLDFTFKSSKVAIFFGQISEISFQSHLIFIIQSFRNFEAGYIWKFICYEVRFGKVRFGSVKITGPVRFGKSGICLVRSTTDTRLSKYKLYNI